MLLTYSAGDFLDVETVQIIHFGCLVAGTGNECEPWSHLMVIVGDFANCKMPDLMMERVRQLACLTRSFSTLQQSGAGGSPLLSAPRDGAISTGLRAIAGPYPGSSGTRQATSVLDPVLSRFSRVPHGGLQKFCSPRILGDT